MSCHILKKCPKCGADGKDIPDLFTKDRSRTDGYEVYCKFCCRKKGRDKWAKHAVEYDKQKAVWYRKNRDRILLRDKKRRINKLLKIL